MIELRIDVAGLAEVQRSLTGIARQVPYASALALNDLAFQVQHAERAAIEATFDRPRPFTVRSVLVDKATRDAPVAVVRIRDEVATYLLPYEAGGAHVLPGHTLLNPKNIRVDQYGQLARGAMKRLADRADRPLSDVEIGEKRFSGKVIRGVWQERPAVRGGRKRTGAGKPVHGRLKLLIRFGDALPVNKHLGFEARAIVLVHSQAGQAARTALQRALATVRR